LGVKAGEEITIEATGSDEQEAINAIQEEMKKNNLI
ncbi:MAG: HPr family phosphocarrier protein, partial [Metamycoplasmataceae bacterium]